MGGRHLFVSLLIESDQSSAGWLVERLRAKHHQIL